MEQPEVSNTGILHAIRSFASGTLIIEDDKALSNGIALALKSNDLEFHQAYSLHEAKAVMDVCEVHLILLDVNLPDGSGLDFLKELRGYSRKPVILLTGKTVDTEHEDNPNLSRRAFKSRNVTYTVAASVTLKHSMSYRYSSSDPFILNADVYKRDSRIPGILVEKRK